MKPHIAVAATLLLAASLLLAACEPNPVNVLETLRGDGGEEPDGGDAGSSTPNCSDAIQYCFSSCGTDIVRAATCVDGDWQCPNGEFLARNYDQVCEGKLGGPCRANNVCDDAVCGTDHRCWYECFDGIGRCRTYDQSEDCCTDVVVNGLCGIPSGFRVCPIGTYEPNACGPSGDAPACTVPCEPYPQNWPHPRTVDFYWTFFGEWAATPAASCSLSSCHGNEEDALRDPPYIPQERSNLFDPGRRNLAIDQLWQAILPGDSTAMLLRKHLDTNAGGHGAAPILLPSQVTAIEAIIANAAVDCE